MAIFNSFLYVYQRVIYKPNILKTRFDLFGGSWKKKPGSTWFNCSNSEESSPRLDPENPMYLEVKLVFQSQRHGRVVIDPLGGLFLKAIHGVFGSMV